MIDWSSQPDRRFGLVAAMAGSATADEPFAGFDRGSADAREASRCMPAAGVELRPGGRTVMSMRLSRS